MRQYILLLLLILLQPSIILAEKAKNDALYKKFQTIFEKTQKDYVEEPDKEKMLDEAIAGMVSSLDPYSNYMKSEELESFIDWAKGEFGGIGVEILPEGAYAIKIISPIDDLAADKAGIKAGDHIIAVNGKAIADIGHYKAIKTLRGEPGTKVDVTIVRDGETKVRDFELTREIVKLKAVKYKRDRDIGYIRIATFNDTIIKEFKKAIRALTIASKNPLKGIILDLRNNPGGILEQGVAISEYFIASGEIVSIKGRIPQSNRSFSASKFAPKSPDIPVVVLINAGSASASEIVAGALQDHKRAVIMGTKSFGKASVQQFMPMENGKSALYLTIGKYYTPKGRAINGKGIEPDIIVEQIKMDYPGCDDITKNNKVINSYLQDSSKKQSKDKKEEKSKKPKMSEMYKKDYQYSRAFDLIYGLSLNYSKE